MPPYVKRAACVALGVVAIPLLSACNSTTSPGAAALVGGQRIAASTLQNEVNAALANPQAKSQFGSDRVGFAREILTHDISVDLVGAIAKDRHVTVTPADITAQTQAFIQQAGSEAAFHTQAAAGGVAPSQLASFVRFAALEQAVETSLIDDVPATHAQLEAEYQKDIDSYDQVHVAHILVKTKSLAETILQKVQQNPASFAALAAKYSTDTSDSKKGGDLGFITRSSVVKAFGNAAFTNPPGSYVVAHSKFGWHVIHVIARKKTPLSSVVPQLKQSLFSSKATSLLQAAVTKEATKLGVHVSPRYGTWQSSSLSVVASPNPVSKSSS